MIETIMVSGVVVIVTCLLAAIAFLLGWHGWRKVLSFLGHARTRYHLWGKGA